MELKEGGVVWDALRLYGYSVSALYNGVSLCKVVWSIMVGLPFVLAYRFAIWALRKALQGLRKVLRGLERWAVWTWGNARAYEAVFDENWNTDRLRFSPRGLGPVALRAMIFPAVLLLLVYLVAGAAGAFTLLRYFAIAAAALAMIAAYILLVVSASRMGDLGRVPAGRGHHHRQQPPMTGTMTVEEFLSELAALGDGWRDANGRLERESSYSVGPAAITRRECPITAVANARARHFDYSYARPRDAGVSIGLPSEDIVRIVRASDESDGFDPELRRRLLSALGLESP